jgi:HEAT repeat protein
MSVLNKISSATGKKNEIPNRELAKELAKTGDKKAITELVENLSNKNKNIQSDCIKVLYEIGEQKAELIAEFDKAFLALLDSKNNRLVWGAMTALDCIAGINPNGIYKHLPKILEVTDKGSVITKDHGINILIKLAAVRKYAEEALPLLLEQFKTSPTNQLPKYAEDAAAIIPDAYKNAFVKVLQARLTDIEKETKRKRVEKVIKKIS